jgi:hypothetical protein
MLLLAWITKSNGFNLSGAAVAPELHLPTAMFPSLFSMSRVKLQLARKSARGLSDRKQIGSTFSDSLRAAAM